MQPLFLVTEPLDQTALDWLSGRAELVCAAPGEDAFEQSLKHAVGLVVRTYTVVDAALLDRAPNLQVVARAGVGLDNIDLDACAKRDITVVNPPQANRQAVVEYVVSVLGHTLRPLPVSLTSGVDLPSWRAHRQAGTVAREMSECTLGILGLGAIGRRVAAVAASIGMRVQHHDLLDIPDSEAAGSTAVSMEVLLKSSDILSIHVDGRASNRGILDAAALEACRADVLLINTARGFVIDELALAALLRARPEMQAVLDVHATEPIDTDNPLLGLPNVWLLPHLASRTQAAQRAMSEVVHQAWNVVSACQGARPSN